jgi:signal transduction histidine kinase|nr:ATP-binding protein [Allgaiera sp.]
LPSISNIWVKLTNSRRSGSGLAAASAAYRQEMVARSGVRIVVAEDCENVVVSGDKERLELVLENLLSNAVKFSPEGGEVRLGVRRTTDGLLGMVTVEDEGAGVPEENRKKIWDRFTQADSSPSRAAEGAGLGLAVAAFLMRLHDGSVNYAPRAQKGSLFWFELPVLSDTPAAGGPEDADVES